MERCAEHEQRVYANSEFGPQQMILNSLVVMQGERDGREDVCVGKMILLFCFFVKKESDEDELGFVRYMECVASLDDVDEALSVCGCSGWLWALGRKGMM